MKDKQLTNSELAALTAQMSLILHAGISTYEGISIMNEDSDDKELKPILNMIFEHLDMGESFYESLIQTHAFPDYFLKMIEIGETSGRLEEVMHSLSIHYQRMHDNNENMKSAMTYPLIMIIMMFLVVVVLMTQVLPIFNQVFQQLGGSITGFSKIVLDLGITLSTYSYFFIGLFIIIIAVFLYLIKNKNGQKSIYHFLTHCRLTKNLSLKLALSQFSSGMSIALSSGLDIDQSLEMSKDLITHKELKEKLEKVQQSLDEKDLAAALVDQQIFSGMYARLVKIGSKTGHMDEIMKKIADQYDQETNERITHLISIIEPTLVAVLSVIVGIILLSVMMPLIGIMSSL
jgi:Type II secretory pathway, component PulF